MPIVKKKDKKKVEKTKSSKSKATVKKTKHKERKVNTRSEEPIKYNWKSTDFRWLSSFQPCCIEMEDDLIEGKMVLFSSAEHAFHYYKTTNALHREKILNAGDASKARYWGSEKSGCPMREDWDELRRPIMRKIIYAKYKQNLPLLKRLVETGARPLAEFTPWDKELYWGTDSKDAGENHHGRITMKVRRKLIKT